MKMCTKTMGLRLKWLLSTTIRLKMPLRITVSIKLRTSQKLLLLRSLKVMKYPPKQRKIRPKRILRRSDKNKGLPPMRHSPKKTSSLRIITLIRVIILAWTLYRKEGSKLRG